jgi:transcriptional regulator with XRE-family HTH domain
MPAFFLDSLRVHYPADMPPRTDRLIAELKAWCDQRRGRRTQLAKFLGIAPQTVTDWFTPKRKKQPTAEQALGILEFLRLQQNQRRNGPDKKSNGIP